MATKFWQYEQNLFRLLVLKPLVVDVAYPLMPQVNVLLNVFSFCKYDGANAIGVKEEHPPLFTPLRNNLALILNEAPEMHESILHPLVDDLPDRHQVLRYCRDM